jgi:flagellar biosynthesis chaperone FliJ
MVDELTPKKEEQAKSILEQLKEERALMEKAIAEAKAEREKIEQIKANDMISGTTDAGRTKEPPHVETAREYAERMSRGG